MGSVGKGSRSKYHAFESGSQWDAKDWFEEHSNLEAWKKTLGSNNDDDSDLRAIRRYTGTWFRPINKGLYEEENWNNVEKKYRDTAMRVMNAIERFELNDGVELTRRTSFVPFGAKDRFEKWTVDDVKNALKDTDGVVQYNGFLSFGADTTGTSISSGKVYIHLKVPPSVGAGAYVDTISANSGEKEFLLNNNSVLQYDTNSVREDEFGRIHVNAVWKGRAAQRVFNKKRGEQ